MPRVWKPLSVRRATTKSVPPWRTLLMPTMSASFAAV
jgi:hypothetical protein